ncbi:MAG TPA: TonB-dependent receptor [Parafilimonas sp.]|nr:TonB-dependent receptor [Parafilimonas sp.]
MQIRKLLPLFLFIVLPFLIDAQVTTSSISGLVKTTEGAALEGATVTAVHTPSGTKYVSASQKGGSFAISNMRVGGPYTVTVTYVGYQTLTLDSIYLDLGVDTKLTPSLQSSTQTLNDVVVTSASRSVGRDLQGPSTQITQVQLQQLPTISRSISDFTRLTPQAVSYSSNSDGSSMGTSFGGENNRYNQFSIDGANATDVFGLAASGTNGGQAGINPIPLDAIEQVQVVLSPYDVRQGGFTGGGINAVTRSGTNQFHGSVYTYYQNQNFVGKSVTTGNKLSDFTDKTLGLRVGGPIIKNKLFFFVNAELYKRSQPLGFNPAESGSGSKFNTSSLDSIRQYLINTYNYDPGSYNDINTERKSDEIFARIDWNIDNKNKLTIRDSYVKGSNYTISRSPTSITFANGGYLFQDKSNSAVVELNSNFSSRNSNMLRLTYNAVRDNRFSSPDFPSITIKDANGLTYNLGGEQYSSANKLNQDNFTLTDNFNIYAGKHTITVGTDNEFFNTSDVFLRAFYGAYQYNSIEDLLNDAAPSQYHVSYSTKGGGDLAPGKVHFGQFGVYGQDAWNISNNFHLTYGLRLDLPVYFNKPSDNTTFNSSDIAKNNDVATNKIPKSNLLFSPRVGFNYDVNGKHQTELRGGVGLFTGRVPFVWVSNQYSNTGVESIKYDVYSDIPPQAVLSSYDPKDPHLGAYIPLNPNSAPSEIDVTSPNFKVPRTFRMNLAADQKLPWGLTGTLEGIFTKTLNDINYEDINAAPPTEMLTIGNSTRPLYSGAKIDDRFSNVIMLTNTSKGYAYDITARLQRIFRNGFSVSAAYTLGHSYSINDGTSSQAISNWRYVYTVNGLNEASLTPSNYDPGSRVIAYITKVFHYGPLYTSIGLVYTGQSGQRFSYAYYGDLNGDDPGNSNDIMYVPANQQEAQLAYPDDWQALETYINSDSYLKDHQGQVLERNGNRTPWENHFDLKVAEGWDIYKTNRLEFTADIFNVANLLNKKWGRSYYVDYQETEPIDVAKSNLWINATTPTFTFNPDYATDSNTGKAWSIADFTSRWNMKIGLRYSF